MSAPPLADTADKRRQHGAAGSVGILATGSYLPENAVSNTEVGEPAGVDDAWITRKTGIHGRRWARPGEATSDLAAHAARAALDRAEVGVDELSLIVVATSTPDSPQPPAAARLASALGAPPTAAAFDLNAVCSGFVFALEMARRFLAGGGGHALVVAADVYSPIIDRGDRRTAVLLGDGAGAAVLGPAPGDRGILDTRLLTFGDQAELIRVPAGGSRRPTSPETIAEGGHYFKMEGRAVADFVRGYVPAAVHAFLDDNQLTSDEVDHLVPHQANGNLIGSLAEELALPKATVHATVDRYGNTGAASVAVTLDDAVQAKDIEPGQIVLLAAFGGGMSTGLALIRW
jgi:3-oxoacyl-[acyl-carrier-protein] synthase-3